MNSCGIISLCNTSQDICFVLFCTLLCPIWARGNLDKDGTVASIHASQCIKVFFNSFGCKADPERTECVSCCI